MNNLKDLICSPFGPAKVAKEYITILSAIAIPAQFLLPDPNGKYLKSVPVKSHLGLSFKNLSGSNFNGSSQLKGSL
ncbi:hypothetical protein G4B88_014513 [Cannabis sativa]|uniref:Uncharacterized protein n=1 Tax=Cannabis sativa TaxID=3483 RepID=A0A7J6I950_CANSA|nr:hypothetical protein G4B88_014513 [Cannabis sativa]